MAKKSRPQIWLEYAFVRFVLGAVQALPMRLAYGLARALGALAWAVDGRHRRRGLDNLDLAFGDSMTASEKRRLVRRVFQHLAMVAAEVVKGAKLITPETVSKYVTVENGEAQENARAAGRGMIGITGHIGNWELFGTTMSLMGVPKMITIARPLDNPKLDALVNRHRERYGQKIVPKQGALRTMVRALKEQSTLIFLVDQNARTGHVFVDFFGHPAATVNAVAALAIRNQTPIVLGVCVREGPGFAYRVMMDDPIWPEDTGDREADVRRLTQAFTSRLEHYIRRYPEQWLWLHRRWKTQPEPDAAKPENSSE